jgi:PAS domain S-box-containing protein
MLHDHLSGHHDMRLVLLSIGVAILASYTALDIGNRIKAARGHARIGWLTAGATAMGGGIWSMHFIAMLAFSMAIPIGYDVTLTAASFLVAVLVTGIALFIVSRGALHIGRIVAAGVFMGLGVAAMHYVGMAAMRMAAEIHYTPGLFILSIVIAVVAASAALWLAFTMEAWWHKLASALIMGAAIAGMHFTGMAAAYYRPIAADPAATQMNLPPQFMALGIATAAFYVLCLGLLSAVADRRLSATAAEGAKALRQSERRHHSLVQNSSDIIAILDDRGAFTYCSQSSQRILGYSATWLIGHRLVEFLQSEDAEKFDEFFARVVASPGTTEKEEIEIRHADYTWLACEVICNNLKADSAIRGIVVNLRDISERKRVIDELRRAKTLAEQASRIKSEFLAAVSHELRTPLNAVIGFSEVIKGGSLGGEAGPRCMDYATHIHDSARHLLRIINNILDLSKAESGQMKLAEDYFRLASLVTDCVQAHAAEAAAAGLAMDLSLPPALPYFYGDKRRIEQALASVLSNALKFTAPGGRVEVTADAHDASGFVIAVRDTGIGMASDEIAMALEPFRQIDARLNRRYEGTGLGLPLTKHLVELHGGVLQIGSEPGKGTRVSLRFPAERIVWTADGHDRQRAVS